MHTYQTLEYYQIFSILYPKLSETDKIWLTLPRKQNILSKNQNNSKLYNIIIGIPITLNFKKNWNFVIAATDAKGRPQDRLRNFKNIEMMVK